jgi:putative redox protein
MSTTHVRWVTGKQFVGTDSTHHSVVLSTADENVGVKPSEMLLVALSACTAVDIVEILTKKQINLQILEVVADGEQDPEPPRPYRKITLTYRVKGENLTEKAIQQAIDLSESKYCSVAATIRGVAEITTRYEILP